MKFIWIIGSIFIFLFLFLFSSPLKAVTDKEKETAAEKLNEQFLREEEQEKREEEQEEQERREEEFQLSPPPIDSSINQPEQTPILAPEIVSPNERCLKLYHIHLNGNTVFSQKKLEKIYVKYLFRCIHKKDINELVKTLRVFYQNKGYSLVRVFLNKKSNFDSGDLFIEIIEGRVQKITIRNKSSARKNNLRRKTAFPFLEGKVFNIFDVEQGLKQINRLSFSQARLQVFPTDQLDFSNLNVTLKKEKHVALRLGASSRGKPGIGDIYGKYDYRFSASLEDTLGLNERFHLSYNRAEFDNEKENLFSRSYSTNLFFPIGYYNLSGAYSGSDYSQPQLAGTQEFISKGDSDNVSLSLKAVVLKKRGKEMSLTANVGTQKNRIFVNDFLVDVSSKKLATATLNLTGAFAVGKGVLQSTLLYRQGVPWFGAREDAPDIAENNAHAQYSLWVHNISYSLNLIKKFPIRYTTRIYGQATDKITYTNIGIGGGGSVRGYSSNTYAGNIGWYQQHTISVRPLQKISALGSFAQAINFSVFYDYGCVEFTTVENDYRCLSGRGTSLSLSYKWFSLSYAYETPTYSTTTFPTEEPVIKKEI